MTLCIHGRYAEFLRIRDPRKEDRRATLESGDLGADIIFENVVAEIENAVIRSHVVFRYVEAVGDPRWTVLYAVDDLYLLPGLLRDEILS